MLKQTKLGDTKFAQLRSLQTLIAKGKIKLGGYAKGKIYGTLDCRSGKRMRPTNRVFFKDEPEAIEAGYRPCGHCMHGQFKQWKQKNGII